MNTEDVAVQIDELNRSLEKLPSMAFTYKHIGTNGVPFVECFRSGFPNNMCKNMSGIYVISDMSNVVMYIGKATKGNLPSRIWSSMGTPVVNELESKTKFPNGNKIRWCRDANIADILRSGQLLIDAFRIEPSEMTSLVEVFLHTWCYRNEQTLPPLNYRIG